MTLGAFNIDVYCFKSAGDSSARLVVTLLGGGLGTVAWFQGLSDNATAAAMSSGGTDSIGSWAWDTTSVPNNQSSRLFVMAYVNQGTTMLRLDFNMTVVRDSSGNTSCPVRGTASLAG